MERIDGFLNNFNINSMPKNARVHFIGIGGISMSGLAEILIGRGFAVSGSDISDSHLLDRLRRMGAQIYIGQKASNIKDYDLIVYTAAISPDNEEFKAAAESGTVLIDRATLLGAVMKIYPYAVAVAGTHGKTSTTSMLSHIFLAADCDPTISIGGELPAIGGNIRVGNSKFFICESCEYHRSFLKFSPFISVILNVEADHLDYFKDIDDIIGAFHDFALLPPPGGAVVVNCDDKNAVKAVLGAEGRVITCSALSRDADYFASDIEFVNGYAEFCVYEHGKNLGRISLGVPGKHNILNAMCAIAAARMLDTDFESIARGLKEFTGVGRRFEKKGVRDGVTVIDDYAHHPTEIKATLSTAKKMDCKNIFCVFQPHTYTRTKALFADFAEALSCGINIIITDIYAAREADTGLVSSAELAESIDNAVYIKDFADCAEYLRLHAKPDDLVITMGAGDVYKVGDLFLE